MGEGAVNAVDDRHGEDRREIFGGPVFFGRRLHAWHNGAGLGVAAQFAAGLGQRSGNLRQQRIGNLGINKQGLQRAADARAAQFGVDDDIDRLLRISRRIDIGMAEAFEMADHRHAGVHLDAFDKAASAARDDDVDLAVEA